MKLRKLMIFIIVFSVVPLFLTVTTQPSKSSHGSHPVYKPLLINEVYHYMHPNDTTTTNDKEDTELITPEVIIPLNPLQCDKVKKETVIIHTSSPYIWESMYKEKTYKCECGIQAKTTLANAKQADVLISIESRDPPAKHRPDQVNITV